MAEHAVVIPDGPPYIVRSVLMRGEDGQVVFYSPKVELSDFKETVSGYSFQLRDVQRERPETCHCGDEADCHGMCAPCKFAVNESCDCSI